MRTLLILLCLLFPFAGFSQETAFVVIDVAGSVTYGQNKKALIGTTLPNNETLIVGNAGSITLACRNSGYAKFAKAGKYTVNSSAYCKGAPDAAFAKLCKFAWHQFADKESHEDWRDHLDNMGAASRGAACFARVDKNINDVYYYQGDFELACTPITPGTKLLVNIYKELNAAPFLQLPLINNKIRLSQLRGRLKEGTDYYWNVTPKDAFCEESHTLHILTRHQRDSIVAQASSVINTNITNKAEQQYMLGISLENMHLFADAFACYKEAAKLSPADKRYGNEVAAFKKRYDIK